MSEDYLTEDDIETENDPDEDTITVNYDIASYPSDFTLSRIAEMWHDEDIVIPDFQRGFVWSIRQSSMLVDSFLSGLPVPPVFFYVDETNKSIVIDGQQRILTAAFYFEGFFGEETTRGSRQVFRLTGLDERSPYAGLTFEQLDATEQRKLKNAVLRAINIRQISPSGESTSAYHIFERLNTGGTFLRPQEIRNCVFRGKFNKDLRSANEDNNWRQILGKLNPDRNQKDVELLLRIFALAGSVDNYEKPMKEFLNMAMKRHVSGSTKKVLNFFPAFHDVANVVVGSIGPKPFHLRGPLNVSALDSIMCVLIENHQQIHDIDLATSFDKLKSDPDFDEHTRINTTDSKTVTERFRIVRSCLLG